MMRVARQLAGALERVGRFAVAESTVLGLAFFGGLVLVSVGVAMLSVPAGLITAGAQLVGTATLYARSGRS